MGIKVTRLYTGPDAESHFEDTELPLKEGGGSWSSEMVKTTGIVFRRTDGNYDSDFHNAPRRQYVITLEGEFEIEIGDGTKRRFGPGEVLLCEDRTGRGHIARDGNKKPRLSILVPLA